MAITVLMLLQLQTQVALLFSLQNLYCAHSMQTWASTAQSLPASLYPVSPPLLASESLANTEQSILSVIKGHH